MRERDDHSPGRMLTLQCHTALFERTATERNAEVSAGALKEAIGRMIRAGQKRHVDILPRNIENCRIIGFAQSQSLARVGDGMAGKRDNDPQRMAGHGDWMIVTWNLIGFDAVSCDMAAPSFPQWRSGVASFYASSFTFGVTSIVFHISGTIPALYS
jgi:hypothetical protein